MRRLLTLLLVAVAAAGCSSPEADPTPPTATTPTPTPEPTTPTPSPTPTPTPTSPTPTPTPTPTPSPTPVTSTPTPTPPPPPPPVSISIVNTVQGFSPATVTVPVGTNVTWTNNDVNPLIPHTATASDGSFDSGSLAQGESYSYVFTAPGTYPYVCTLHPQTMTGTITVE